MIQKQRSSRQHSLLKLLLHVFFISLPPTTTAAAAAAKKPLTPPITTTTTTINEKKPTRTLTSLDLALCGAIATMIGDASMHPIDCIKTLQQSNEGKGLSMLGAGRRIFQTNGIGGFYSGMGTYVTSDGGAGALKFATYEALKTYIKDKIPEDYYGAALFSCAAIAFVASSIILVPGELLKQRLQMGQISSVPQGIKQIWTQEGWRGFYQGYSGVCLRDVPYTMMELGIYDNLKSLYLKMKNKKNDDTTASITQVDEIIAAGVTGAITGYLTAPFDTIKTKLMVDNAGLYRGFVDCFRKTLAEGGTAAVFQGGAARVAWLVPFTAIYLPIYEVFKRRLAEMFVGEEVETKAAGKKGALAVKGGAQVMNRGRMPWRRSEMVVAKEVRCRRQFLDRTDSFVSF